MSNEAAGAAGGPGAKALAAVLVAAALLAGTAMLVRGGEGAVAGGPAQETVRLAEAEAAHAEGFSVVSTVREMPDGTVVVADALGQTVQRIDLDAGTAETLGRTGMGPDEYRQPDAVWPLPGGRSLLVDLGNGRLTELGPELAFGDTRPYAIGNPMAGGGLVMAIPQAVDGEGRLYFRSMPSMDAMTADSAYVLRLDLESEKVDSAARFKVPEMATRTTGGGNNQNVSVSPIPLSPADAWGVAPDGRVVVARVGDYHVEWIAPDGSVARGPPIDHRPVRIGRAEREEWAHQESETGGGLSVAVQMVNGQMTIAASRGGPGGDDEPDLDDYDWPDAKPPFYAGSPIPVDGNGRAWVRRHRDAGDAPAYDVFGPDGSREMVVELPQARRVVSFGDGKVYVVRMDDLGLQYLERYALP